jgi:hypothetical protein
MWLRDGQRWCSRRWCIRWASLKRRTSCGPQPLPRDSQLPPYLLLTDEDDAAYSKDQVSYWLLVVKIVISRHHRPLVSRENNTLRLTEAPRCDHQLIECTCASICRSFSAVRPRPLLRSVPLMPFRYRLYSPTWHRCWNCLAKKRKTIEKGTRTTVRAPYFRSSNTRHPWWSFQVNGVSYCSHQLSA